MRRLLVACVSLLGMAGCLSLPKASTPLQPDWLVQAQLETVWQAAISVSNVPGRRLIAQDQEAGVLTIVDRTLWPDHPVYVNLRLSPAEDGRSTQVLVFAHVRGGRYLEDAESVFLREIESLSRGGGS